MEKQLLITRSELFAEFNSIQNQYVYFIIAIDASAIAYTAQKMDNRVYSWSLILLGIAVLFWLISMYSGIKFNQLKKERYLLELNYLDLLEETNIANEQNQKTIERIQNDAESNQNKAYKHYTILNYLMFGGVIFFILWILLEMALRTFK